MRNSASRIAAGVDVVAGHLIEAEASAQPAQRHVLDDRASTARDLAVLAAGAAA